ncbi:MAG TPA: hypothetical protein VL442_11870 [Mucilaginibacter sp.]|nr:hypothetical protein [Mucilaginibacter sp.]
MKKISLSAAAILLAAATLFAEGTEMIKNHPKKAKQECQGTCLKKFKTQKCTSQDACSDMKTCGATCSK